MTAVRLIPGDCLEVIPQLVAEGVVVDAIVTDPPYHLTQITGWKQRADGGLRAPRGQRCVDNTGFMGTSWDGGDIAFRPETWAVAASVLRPGGYLLAFGGTRTHHRIWCAIEDAGFVIQDTIMWLYGSGFPKGKQQLKPAFEPICVAYKPGGKRELQVDECRIGNGDDRVSGGPTAGWFTAGPAERATGGRWPANLATDGSDEVMAAFAAFGETNGGGRLGGGKRPGGFGNVGAAKGDGVPVGPDYPDHGSTARFFYCTKAGGEDRWGSKHPTVKPVALMQWLVRLVTAPGGTVLDPFAGSGATGVAALATGRNAILIEREPEYIADIRERMAHYEGNGRHSLVAKNKAAASRLGLPLFDALDLPADWQERDSAGSWRAAVDAMRERLK